jgi:predicted permease
VWNSFSQDIRYALRVVRRNTGFFVVAALIIGLGIGANTAIFSVVNPLLLRELPFAQPDRLVWVANTGTGGSLSSVTSRVWNLRDYRAMNTSFEQISGYFAFFDYIGFTLSGDGDPERLTGVPVAIDFLDVLGVQPQIGRNFTAEEDLWSTPTAVILSHGFWQRRYGGDPSIVGQAITLNNAPINVVGVLPEWFDFASYFSPGAQIDFLSTYPITDETNQMGNTLVMVGRLKPDATVESAQIDLDRINEQLLEADPSRWGLGAAVTNLQEKITGGFRSAMLLLAGAAGLVMLIVCANISNLLLARAATRRKEMAVRTALGASRMRLVRQLLTESLMLSGFGAVLGVFVAYAVTRVVAGSNAFSIPMLHSVSIDGTVLLFTLVAAVFAGLLFGIAPALQISLGRQHAALTDSSRGSSEGRAGGRFREVLVVAEVALACMLLIGGGLLLRSFYSVLDVDLGFQPEGVAAWRIESSRNFEDLADRLAYYEPIAREVEALPGILSVGMSDTLPLGRNRSWGVAAKGVTYERGEQPGAFPRLVDSGYLQTMRIPLLAGRYLSPDDTVETENVVVINEVLARTLWPGVDPINQVLELYNGDWRVVGVVANVRHTSLEEEGRSEMYLPITQHPDWGAVELVTRSEVPPETLINVVRATLRAADPTLPTDGYQTLEKIVDRAVSPRRFILLLLDAFAVTALLLASLGIYGVLSYSVTRRAPEIGIRMALGASAAQVQRRVLARTLALTSAGVIIGLAGAIWLTRLVESLLYGVEATDPLTYAAVIIMLGVIAGLAGYLPARRASHIDPMAVLGAE